MQFKIGTEPKANIEQGIITENTIKVYKLKTSRFIKGLIKNNREQTLMINEYPYLLHSFVAKTKEITIGITEINKIVEFVCGVILDP
jgi:hypothetical protein